MVGFGPWVLRRLTHQSWLGSGWPQWVAQPYPDVNGTTFDYEINRFQSIAYSCLIVGNLIVGFFIDYMTRKFPS